MNQALVFCVNVAATGALGGYNNWLSLSIACVTWLTLASYWLAAGLLTEVPARSYALLGCLFITDNRLFKLANKWRSMIRESKIINSATIRSYVNTQLVDGGCWGHLLNPLLNLLFVKVIAWQVGVALRLIWLLGDLISWLKCKCWFRVRSWCCVILVASGDLVSVVDWAAVVGLARLCSLLFHI